MPNEKEILYSFAGDTSSLKSATSEAIALLDKYSDSMEAAATAGSFSASKKSTQSFNASINRMVKDVTGLQRKLKSVGDVRLPTASQPAQAMAATLKTLQDQLTGLNTANNITTKTLTGMTQSLNATRQALSSTVPQVDRLVASEERFQGVLDQVKTKTEAFAARMVGVKASVSTVFDPVSQRVQSFGNLFQRMFDSIGAKVQSFRDKASTAFSRVSQLAETVVSALRRTSDSSEASADAASAAAKAHDELADSLDDVAEAADQDEKDLEDESKTLDKKSEATKKATKGHDGLAKAINALGRNVRRETAKLGQFVSKLNDMTSLSNLATRAVAGIASVKLGEWLSNAVTESIRYVENLNLFTVAMGSAVDTASEFVEKMSESLGLDPSNIMRHAGYFYQLSDAIKMPSEASAILALSLTKASNDIASLFNVDIETVTENLASGMQGMSRAVRKYGIDIRNATLQTIAARYGLDQQVGSMSEANRQALRYIAIMEQTAKATSQLQEDVDGVAHEMGDFARNIETPANQLRIFREQMSQLGRAIGDIFIKPLATVIAYVNGFIMALKAAIEFITTLLGISSDGLGGAIDGFSEEADAVDSVGDSAEDAAKKMKKLIAPFDELNILSEESGAAGPNMDELLDPALMAALEAMELKLDEIRMKAHDVRDALLEFFGLTWDAEGHITFDKSLFEDSLLKAFPEWEDVIKQAFENWNLESIGQILGVMVSGSLGKFADWVSWDNLGPGITKFITDLHTVINSFLETLRGEDIGRAIGEAFNTGLQTFHLFLSGINWARVGVILGDAINAAVESVDWATLGASLVLKWNILIDILLNAAKTINWKALASALSTGINSMVNSFKLEELAEGLGLVIQGVLEVISAVVLNFDWAGQGERLGTAVQSLWDSVDWGLAGETLSAGLAGIVSFLAETVAAIDWQKIGDDIGLLVQSIDWSGIATSLTLAANSVVVGLLTGINAALPSIIQAAGDIINGLVQGLVEALPTLVPIVIDIVTTIVDGLVGQIPMLITAALDLILALVDGLIAAIPQLVEAIPQIITALVDGLLLAVPEIIQAGITLLVALVDALPEIITVVVDAVAQILSSVLEAIAASIPDLILAGIDLLVALIEALPEIIDTIVAAIPQIIGALLNALIEALPEIILAGVQLFSALVTNLPEIIWEIIKAVPQIVASIVTAFTDLLGEFINIGVNLLKGIWQGITDTASWLTDKIGGFFGDIIDGVKDTLGIKSPSKEFAAIGEYTVEGLAGGISSQTKIVAKVFDSMVTSIMTKAKELEPQLSAWGQQVTGTMLEQFQRLWLTMDTEMFSWMAKQREKLGVTQSMYQTWGQALTNLIQAMFRAMWGNMLEDMDGFGRTLDERLANMVSAAQSAAAAIANALQEAQDNASQMAEIAATTSQTAAPTAILNNIPMAASGGIVQSPTLLIAGEGAYNEAIIPLDDSPQMQDFADTVAEAVARVGGAGAPQEVNVKVVIGDKEWKTQVYKDAKEGETLVGATPVKVGV